MIEESNDIMEEIYRGMYGDKYMEILKRDEIEQRQAREKYNRAKEIITKLKEIRIKYFPDNDIEKYSDQDKKTYNDLNNEFNQLIETGRMSEKQQLNLEKRTMENYTNGYIKSMKESDYFDSDDLNYNFRNSLETAKVAVEAMRYAIETKDWDKLDKCEEICEVAKENFDGHDWGKDYIEELSNYRRQQLTKVAEEELDKIAQGYEKNGENLTLEELQQNIESINELTWYISNGLYKAIQLVDSIKFKIDEIQSKSEIESANLEELTNENRDESILHDEDINKENTEESFEEVTIEEVTEESISKDEVINNENPISERSDLEEWQEVLEQFYNETIGSIGNEIQLTEEMKIAIRNGEGVELPTTGDRFIDDNNKELCKLYNGLLNEFKSWQKEQQREEVQRGDE